MRLTIVSVGHKMPDWVVTATADYLKRMPADCSIEIKEIKFRPGTDDGDYNIKMRNIKRFLADGDKCKITLRFRGREITHQEIGLAMLQRMRDELGDLIVVEQFPKLEGRQMIMMIAPGKKKPGSVTKPVADTTSVASA